MIRVVLTTILGYLGAIVLPPMLGLDTAWGTAGLTASAGVAGWIEFLMLRRTLNRRLGPTGLPRTLVAQLWGASLAGGAVGWFFKLWLSLEDPILSALAVLGPYGITYLAMTLVLRVPEAEKAIGRARAVVGSAFRKRAG